MSKKQLKSISKMDTTGVKPKVFTKIHLHFVVTGKNLKEAHVKRAVELSAEKYCSASILMGRAGVEVTHDYEIVEID